MKKLILQALAGTLAAVPALAVTHTECGTDSVDMLAYSALDGSSGLRLAFKCNRTMQWKPIGNGMSFVSSDFGPWGSHKKMFAPDLTRDADGTWTATWIADISDAVMATATSPDLISWAPQTYAISTTERDGIAQYNIAGQAVSGAVTRVPKCLIDSLMAYAKKRERINELYGERMADDPERFQGLRTLSYKVTPEPKKSKKISDKFIGIFFEDINYAADGGLYAELVQNRDFEYIPADHRNDKKWNALYAWTFPDKDKGSIVVSEENPVHPNNPHYLAVNATEGGYRLVNSGFDGIAVKAGETYDFSIMARAKSPIALIVSLCDSNGNTVATGSVEINGENWHTYTCPLVARKQVDDCRLELSVAKAGNVDVDMVSLFPRDTFKGRKNGLRKDLAQTLADLKPQFVRFPGGCVAHGDGIDNIYDWKGSIGPLEARKPLPNIWRYHQSRGLGYYEYFLMCEDFGATPLPVLAAGVPCQNSGTASHYSHDAITSRGQQGGIPMEDMDAYVQDVLDLIEYANGDPTTTWGSKRAQAGHPEPFNLKYIGIGNEDMITDVFEERFRYIYDAVKSKHPEVEVVGTVGPFYEGSDYTAGWKLAEELDIPLVDEHYYVAPGWMIYNQDYYDNYKRGGTRVYLGEYAAHVPGKRNCIESALACALYLTAVERNADVVEMTSYAPLLAKNGHTQWNPDLIYFDNTDVMPTTDYYVQQMYGNNSGTKYIPASTTIDTDNEKAQARVASSIVQDEATGDYIIKLANLLPVAVDTDIDLSPLKVGKKQKASLTVLSGSPVESSATPQSSPLSLPSGKTLDYTMPPYSFSVIRISK